MHQHTSEGTVANITYLRCEPVQHYSSLSSYMNSIGAEGLIFLLYMGLINSSNFIGIILLSKIAAAE